MGGLSCYGTPLNIVITIVAATLGLSRCGETYCVCYLCVGEVGLVSALTKYIFNSRNFRTKQMW